MSRFSTLHFIFALVFISKCSAQDSIITNPVTTIADASVIQQGIPLTLTCNADSAGLSSQFQLISKLSLRRYMPSTTVAVTIATYNPDDPLSQEYFESSGRNWEVEWSPVQFDGVNTRARGITVTMQDTVCSDAAVYECVVTYYDSLNQEAVHNGQQNLTARAAIALLSTVKRPDFSTYTEGDNITMECRVNGPPDVSLVWQRGFASSMTFETFTDGVTETDPVPRPNTDCNELSYESFLALQVSLADNGMMFRCVVIYANTEMLTENETLSIIAATDDGDGVVSGGDNSGAATGGGGGTNIGAIVGPIIGVLALIIIVGLLVYFCWYRKKPKDDEEKDAENPDKNADLHAPPPVFYSKPNKPPKDDHDNGTWGKGSDDGDTWGRKPRYDNYDKGDKYDDNTYYNSDRKPSSSSSKGGRRGRIGSAGSNKDYPKEGDRRGDYHDDEAEDGRPDETRSAPRYEKRRRSRDAPTTNHAPTPDVTSRSEDEASDAPLSGDRRQRPRPKRRTQRPQSGGYDRDDYPERSDYRDTRDPDYRDQRAPRDPDSGLHYAQLDLAPAADRDNKGRRGRGRRDDAPVEYAEIRGPVGMTNVALDTSYDSNSPGRYAKDQEPGTNGPPGYSTDEDNRRSRYNRGYASDEPVDDGDGRENYSRRRRDRGGRGSRSRDHTDAPSDTQPQEEQEPYRYAKPEDIDLDEGGAPGRRRYSTDDDGNNYRPHYNNMPVGGFGDPNIGTAI